jgi:uncharacterized coiled-coil protein SlyX
MPKQMKGKVRFMKNRNTITIFTTILLACFGFLPGAQPVVPAPDGGYPGGNTAEGQNALFSLTTGVHNTAVGFLSLGSDITGSYNTAVGSGTLLANTADGNTATGVFALISNTIGGFNTANGALALFSNTEGEANTATGFAALYRTTTTGHLNTAYGYRALFNATGSDNTAIGGSALSQSTTGSSNIALGVSAGINHTNGSNNIDIGNRGVDGESDIIRIGTVGSHTATFIAGIHDVNQGGTPLAVTINASGQLGTQAPSSRRFKKEIQPMDGASEAILALKPVTFHYKSDTKDTPQFGLIAEEVAEVNPDLVVRDENGDIYTVRYDAVNAMLLNEFLKAYRKVQELKSSATTQEATITQLKSALAQQQKDFQATAARQQEQIEALGADLQKVSAQLAAASPSSSGLEVGKFATGRIRRGGPAPRVVVKNQ